ncbi:ABC transporter ATP-binding protein [Spiroplasma chinense]|uniref:ABC transporter ATP-binding protein n=1 Tax=Spiroplasma chinense TaxID=216932 RepID=A0A5B9Y4E4_9MOLU|nr:ATP-binding cassette domain-containing protein [Spiroplasma chinense]QEH62038.1 ABC transporter ATP-binding protein [Spiroplasma chinense]
MKKEAIVVENLNKRFKSGYGVFDINFNVQYGKVFGYLGPNGAGKSTTIRSLMGFIKPDSGTSTVMIENVADAKQEQNEDSLIAQLTQFDSWTDANKVQRNIGYVPGEIAFPIQMTGIELLKQIFKLRNMTNWDDVRKYIDYWEFNPNMKIKKMSKGMKQKVALVIAWMHNPDIIVLDEPTTGLDPLMQEKFVKLVQKSKEEGKAIILSSHIFSEIERTCDYVSIIKRGKIISTIDIKDIQYNDEKTYEVKFKSKVDKKTFDNKNFEVKSFENNTLTVVVENKHINDFIKLVSGFDLEFIKEHPLNLEQYFMKYYQNEIETDVVDSLDNIELKSSNKKSIISFELIKDTIRKSAGLWFFMTALPTIMIIIAFSVLINNPNLPVQVSPEAANGLTWNQILMQTSQGLITSSTGISYLLLLVYVLVTGNSLVASEVDKGTMVNLLTTNQSRKSVILTKMLTFINSLFVSILIQFLATTITVSAWGQGANLDFGVLAMNYLGLFLILFAVSAIAFFSSTWFNKSSASIGAAAGIAILFYVLYFVSMIDDSVAFFKYFSLNTLFNVDYTSVGQVGKYLAQYLVLLGVGIGLYVGSYFVFTKKDLPL